MWFFSEEKAQCWLKIMTQKHYYSVAALEILKQKKHFFVSAAQISVKTAFVVSVFVVSESSCSLYERDQLMSIINIDEWIQKNKNLF